MRWADVAKVEEAAEAWNDNIIQCRIYSHTWRPNTVQSDGRTYTITQRCTRCHSRRIQTMDSRGYAPTGWRYQYRDGYLLENLGRVDDDGRAVLRLAAIRNLTVLEYPEEESD